MGTPKKTGKGTIYYRISVIFSAVLSSWRFLYIRAVVKTTLDDDLDCGRIATRRIKKDAHSPSILQCFREEHICVFHAPDGNYARIRTTADSDNHPTFDWADYIDWLNPEMASPAATHCIRYTI